MRTTRLLQGATLACVAIFAPLALSANAARSPGAVAVCEHTCKTLPDRPCVACLEEGYERDLQTVERDYEQRARQIEREARRASERAEKAHADRLSSLQRSLTENERSLTRESEARERELERLATQLERQQEQSARAYEEQLASEERRLESEAAALERRFAGDEDGLEEAIETLEDQLEAIQEELELAWEQEAERFETELEAHENEFAVIQEQLEHQWDDQEDSIEHELETFEHAFEEQMDQLDIQVELQLEALERECESLRESQERAVEGARAALEHAGQWNWDVEWSDDNDCDDSCGDACSGCRNCDDCCDDEDSTDGEASVVRVLERALRQAGIASSAAGERVRNARSLATSSRRQARAPRPEVYTTVQDAGHDDLFPGYAFQVDSDEGRITVRDAHGAHGTATIDELEELAPGVYVLRGKGGEVRLERAGCGDEEKSVVFRIPGEKEGVCITHPSGSQGKLSFHDLGELDSGVYVLGDEGDGIALFPARPTAPTAPTRAARPSRGAVSDVRAPLAGGEELFFSVPAAPSASPVHAAGPGAAPWAVVHPDPAPAPQVSFFGPSANEVEEVSELLREMREELRSLRSAVRDLRQEVRSLTQDVR